MLTCYFTIQKLTKVCNIEMDSSVIALTVVHMLFFTTENNRFSIAHQQIKMNEIISLSSKSHRSSCSIIKCQG